MSSSQESTAAAAAGSAIQAAPRGTLAFWQRLARTLAWSVLLGLALEGLILGVRTVGSGAPGWAQIAADTVQKTSWSLLVCVALAAAQHAHKLIPVSMGLTGLCVAPAALIVARSLHKGTLQALSQLGSSAPAAPVLVPALLKALEYGLFGIWVGRLAERADASLRRYLLTGLTIGSLGALGLALWKQPALGTLVVDSVNELCFPVGCAFVLFVSSRAARSLPSA